MYSNLARSDISFWMLSALLGSIAVRLPFLLDFSSPAIESRFAVSLLAVALSAAFLGYLRPQRPWRWGVGTMLLVPVIHLAVSASLWLAVLALVVSLPRLGLLLLVAIAGALLGAGVRTRVPAS